MWTVLQHSGPNHLGSWFNAGLKNIGIELSEPDFKQVTAPPLCPGVIRRRRGQGRRLSALAFPPPPWPMTPPFAWRFHRRRGQGHRPCLHPPPALLRHRLLPGVSTAAVAKDTASCLAFPPPAWLTHRLLPCGFRTADGDGRRGRLERDRLQRVRKVR